MDFRILTLKLLKFQEKRKDMLKLLLMRILLEKFRKLEIVETYIIW